FEHLLLPPMLLHSCLPLALAHHWDTVSTGKGEGEEANMMERFMHSKLIITKVFISQLNWRRTNLLNSGSCPKGAG
ncbi:MAG: hypothetical protein ACP5Q3_14125, partial [bacterium]